MAALNVSNMEFVAGANAAKCEAPVSSLPALAQDVDVAGLLPVETGKDSDHAPLALNPLPPAASVIAPPPVAPPITPPFAGMQTSMPVGMAGPIPLGGGMSVGMAVLTD